MSFADLRTLLQDSLTFGASSAVESLFGKEEFSLWRRVVNEAVIEDNGESLVEIPSSEFPRFHPHAYIEAGAPYESASPFFLRTGVVQRLRLAKEELQKRRSGWGIKIFDGYRPMRVQRFLVEHFYQGLLRNRGLDPSQISPEMRQSLLQEVYQIFAKPKDDPKGATPHSTGGAVDLTLLDEAGAEVPMGSPIDAMPPECLPGHYASSTGEGRTFHENRLLLEEVMSHAGFYRLPQEWWHFSYGDPAWSVLCSLARNEKIPACYGRVD